jgi:hypothetical protein
MHGKDSAAFILMQLSKSFYWIGLNFPDIKSGIFPALYKSQVCVGSFSIMMNRYIVFTFVFLLVFFSIFAVLDSRSPEASRSKNKWTSDALISEKKVEIKPQKIEIKPRENVEKD